MTMRWCLPCLRRSGKSSTTVLRKSLDDDECETSVVTHPKSEVIPKKRSSLAEAVERISKEFELSDDAVQHICDGFVEQMNEGLRKHGGAIEQLPSFITNVPTGREFGTYLAVDMGGTNIRVCIVTFNGDGTYASGQNKVAIPTSLMSSNNPKDLFDWVARMVQTFIEGLDTGSTAVDSNGAQWRSQTTFDLGFTFSHAVQQRDVNSGTLIRWSKGFDIEGVVGQDVCALLQDAFDALGLRIRVTALVNDTVGTLLAQAYMSHGPSRTFAGAVFGTGTNGAYVEKASNITKLGDDVTDPEAIMVVNSEWGNFDQARRFLTSTTYDRAIDAASVNPDFEIFEKQISGMYLGEILRVVVLSLSKDATVDFFGCVKIPDTSELYIPWSLDSSFLSHLESDNSLELAASRFRIAQWLGNVQISFEVASAIRTIAHVIVLRSARLSAVALGAFLVQTACLAKIDGGQERVSIGVDGSLIELYPGFITHIRCALRSIKGVGAEGEARVDITIAKDGSGVGAALAAHIAAMQLS